MNSYQNTNPILCTEELELRSGKRMFAENSRHDYNYNDYNVNNENVDLDLLKNAGVQGKRISELNLNSRKKITYVKSDSSQMRDALNHSNTDQVVIMPKKKPLTFYSGYEQQDKYFETKLTPDLDGKMSICVGRKSGSATIKMNLEDYDLEKTYHTWKRIMNRDSTHTRSNLENDRFLTVQNDALRYDKCKEIKNRNPPIANTDGPFEKEINQNEPIHKRNNLDRTLTPKVNSQRNDCFRKVLSNYKPTSYLIQVHNDNYDIDNNHINNINIHDDNTNANTNNIYKGYGNGDEAFKIKGVRRTQFPWIDNNRLKNILQYNSNDDI